MSVHDICERQVDLVTNDESVQRAAARLRDRMIGSLVICDHQRQPMGILTDRDLALRVVAAGLDPTQVTVGMVMTPSPCCVHFKTPIDQALAAMRCGPYRRLPVIDDDGQLVGLITLDDILSMAAKEFSHIGQLVQRESPASLVTA